MKRKIAIEVGDVRLSNTRSDDAFVDDGVVALALRQNGNIVREELVDVLDLIDALKEYLYATAGESNGSPVTSKCQRFHLEGMEDRK